MTDHQKSSEIIINYQEWAKNIKQSLNGTSYYNSSWLFDHFCKDIINDKLSLDEIKNIAKILSDMEDYCVNLTHR